MGESASVASNNNHITAEQLESRVQEPAEGAADKVVLVMEGRKSPEGGTSRRCSQTSVKMDGNGVVTEIVTEIEAPVRGITDIRDLRDLQDLQDKADIGRDDYRNTTIDDDDDDDDDMADNKSTDRLIDPETGTPITPPHTHNRMLVQDLEVPGNGMHMSHAEDMTNGRENMTVTTVNVTDTTVNVTDTTVNMTTGSENLTNQTENVTNTTENMTNTTVNMTNTTDNMTNTTANMTDVTVNATQSTENMTDRAVDVVLSVDTPSETGANIGEVSSPENPAVNTVVSITDGSVNVSFLQSGQISL